jgi:glycerophosphoryl diester phosphodiesterase
MVWGDLAQLDAGSWHSRQFAGEPLPTLQAIAAFVLRNSCQLNIEIKPTPGLEEQTGRVIAAQAGRLWAGAEVPPLLSSFRPDALAGARATAPALPRALLLDTLWPDWFEMAAALGCVAVVTNHRLMDAALVERLHGAGWRALVYTVNDAEDASRLLALGVDGLITDAIDQFAPASA